MIAIRIYGSRQWAKSRRTDLSSRCTDKATQRCGVKFFAYAQPSVGARIAQASCISDAHEQPPEISADPCGAGRDFPADRTKDAYFRESREYLSHSEA